MIVTLVPGAVKKEVYFMAIIDILTHYDAKKKAAHAAKTVKHGVSLLIRVFGCGGVAALLIVVLYIIAAFVLYIVAVLGAASNWRPQSVGPHL